MSVDKTWVKLFEDDINFNVLTKVLPTKGNLVYEYNPFRNYRLSRNMYEFQGSLYSIGELYSQFGIGIKCKARRLKQGSYYDFEVVQKGGTLNDLLEFDEDGKPKYEDTDNVADWFYDIYKEGRNIDRTNFERALNKANLVDAWDMDPDLSSPVLREKGELVDFITEDLKISLDHPLHIIPSYSYDGSVNLIINDGINIPRLINSRFSATGRNTYEIVDRKGNNDTNIYDLGEQFDSDTSLYKRVSTIPEIIFRGVFSGGNLKVGNYHFYFRLSDADGNETDFIGESGLVSVFVGMNSYQSVHTGLKNQNSFKQVLFIFENLDPSYNYMIVYYSRSTAEDSQNNVVEYVKIDKKFLIHNADNYILTITGFEETIPVTFLDINVLYNVVDSAQTTAICQNMLFMANVNKPNIPYAELQDLSLRFLPYLKEENYDAVIDENYIIRTSEQGYIDPTFIYNKTGYWGNEIYRIGIVYILPNGTLSPVFNIRGANKITSFNPNGYTDVPLYELDNGIPLRKHISYNEETFYLTNNNGEFELENVKGVISLDPTFDTNAIYSIDVRVSDEVIQEVKKYAKGYFFVRLLRTPLVLTQAIAIGIDKEARTPTLPVAGGILQEYQGLLENTHVETADLDDVNYVSEGFLNRYKFEIVEKESTKWKTALKIAGIALAVVAAVAATVFTCGAAGVALGAAGAALAGTATAAITTTAVVAGGAAAVATSGLVIGTAVVAGATIVGAGLYAAGDAISTEYNLKKNAADAKKYDRRNTVIPKGYEMKEVSESRKLSDDFGRRFIFKDPKSNLIQGLICPDFSVNPSFYNQIFTGNDHLIKTTKSQSINIRTDYYCSNYFNNDGRHFFIPSYADSNSITTDTCKIVAVLEGTKAIGCAGLTFRSKAGEAEEAYRYEFIGKKYKDETMYTDGDKKKKDDSKNAKVSLKKINSDVVRGIYCSYLGFSNDNKTIGPCDIVNIYTPGYNENKLSEYFLIRMGDNSLFYAISDRYDLNTLDKHLLSANNTTLVLKIDRSQGYYFNLYRGDCYLCLFTQRIIRNFNDSLAPYNHDIVDSKSWKDHYDPDDTSKYSSINRGDVNAVPLGMWLTFRVRSSNNLNVRTLDGSNVSEVAASGHERGFYPYYPMSVEGSYKIPDSLIYNKGFTKSLSERMNVEVVDAPYILNWYGTRIMYSDININDAYKNGFRVFQGTHFKDYTREYGSITKLITIGSDLLVVFEHGIAKIHVNERAIAAQGSGGYAYINTSNVLPDNPVIITDMYGSLWAESVLKVPSANSNFVYGVDTIAKKIWRTNGSSFECISDDRVLKFLNDNITLGERELDPKIGIRNVKTLYNSFKQDVLFTFYDNTYGFEEKVWNLCWNEKMGRFVTFYSWVPSYMENINNIPFSFNRDVSKWIAKLGVSHNTSSIADGITLSNNVIDKYTNTTGNVVSNFKFDFRYLNKNGREVIKTYTVAEESRNNFIGVLQLRNRTLPNDLLLYIIKFVLERDNYLNHEMFEIEEIKVISDDGRTVRQGIYLPNDAKYSGHVVPIYALKFKNGHTPTELLSELYYRNKLKHSFSDYDTNKENYINYIEQNGVTIPDSLNPEAFDKPIYKNIQGKRVNLKRNELLNPDKIVTLLNIKAEIQLVDTNSDPSLSDLFNNLKAGLEAGTTLIDAGYYESVVAVIPKWNMLFLSTDFWRHGQAGIIDIADDIYPTYWYGKQHPFEFECVVVNDPSVHKIFTNLELISNKAKPESFHYEIVGETYDFVKDKPNMYFRQEAMKALWLYNGADICYNRNFLKVQPEQLKKSADFPHNYYTRQDTINEIEDYYISTTLPKNSKYDYKHLSGAEIVYYPNRQEYRIWQHSPAIILNDLSQDDPRSIISANCLYLEDKWRININPIVICYKNEYNRNYDGEVVSTWTDPNRPPLPVMNSPIPDQAWETIKNSNGKVDIPEILDDLGYTFEDIDQESWLSSINIYGTSFGEALNRRELDVRDRFMKVRIRYSGEELAIIDFLNTIYRISYA